MSEARPVQAPCHSAAGFTLTELLIAGVMLLAILASVASLFESANRHTRLTGQRYQQEADIDADLALISKLNEHYSCARGIDQCESSIGSHPTQNGYFPDPASADLVASFEAACNQIGGQDLLSPLTGDESTGTGGIIERNSARADLEAKGLIRTISRANPPDGRGHRYTVAYFSGEEMLRQNTFVPTTVNWCPDIP